MSLIRSLGPRDVISAILFAFPLPIAVSLMPMVGLQDVMSAAGFAPDVARHALGLVVCLAIATLVITSVQMMDTTADTFHQFCLDKSYDSTLLVMGVSAVFTQIFGVVMAVSSGDVTMLRYPILSTVFAGSAALLVYPQILNQALPQKGK